VRDRYVAVVYRLLDILAQDVEDHEDALEAAKDVFSDEASIQQALGEWLDMDAVVASYCQAHRLNEPFDLEERLTLYLEAMEGWINHHSIGDKHENQT